jgi:hypothetical protein
MKKVTAVLSCLVCAWFLPELHAAVTVNAPTNVFSGDFALNGPFPAYQSLDDIVISEQAKNDFAVQSDATLVLSAPGWRFEPNVGNVRASGGGDLSGVRMDVSDLYVTITFSARKTQKLDVLTLSGLRLCANDAASLKVEKMVRPQNNPGNAVINGVNINTTVFAYLGQTTGAWSSFAPLAVVGMTNSHALLRFGVLSGGPAHLEASCDFVTWNVIATNLVPTNSIIYFEDPNSSTNSHCFYRLKQF